MYLLQQSRWSMISFLFTCYILNWHILSVLYVSFIAHLLSIKLRSIIYSIIRTPWSFYNCLCCIIIIVIILSVSLFLSWWRISFTHHASISTRQIWQYYWLHLVKPLSWHPQWVQDSLFPLSTSIKKPPLSVSVSSKPEQNLANTSCTISKILLYIRGRKT